MARTFRSAGEGKLNRHLAAQAAYEEAAAVIEEAPSKEAPPEHWAAYIQSAQGKATAAIIEMGRRISLAHAAYKAQGQSWGRTWEDWCQENLGIQRSLSHKLIKIGGNLCHEVTQILPADTHSLYTLARVKEKQPEAYAALVQEQRLHASMSRQEVEVVTAEVLPKRSPRKPSNRSLKVDAGIAELLEQRASARGQTINELLMDLLAGL